MLPCLDGAPGLSSVMSTLLNACSQGSLVAPGDVHTKCIPGGGGSRNLRKYRGNAAVTPFCYNATENQSIRQNLNGRTNTATLDMLAFTEVGPTMSAWIYLSGPIFSEMYVRNLF